MNINLSDITFGTTNNHKLQEVSQILGVTVKGYSKEQLELINKVSNGNGIPEIQSLSIQEIVESKARSVYDILGTPVLVEDTGYFIEVLKGFPGPFVKFIVDDNGPGIDLLFKMMNGVENRKVSVQTGFSLYNGTDFFTGIGILNGKIPLFPRGNKFGWSNAFEVNELGLTFGEITEEQKNKISMRKLALEKFLQQIQK